VGKKKIVWDGLDELRPFLVPLEKLKLDPINARKHNDRNLEVIKNSFIQFGQDQILVIENDGTVQKGNARLMVARELGWTHLVAIKSGDEGTKARLRGIVDNRSAEIGSEWNFGQLDLDFEDIVKDFDIKEFGFNPEELKSLFKDEIGSEGSGGEDDGDKDEEKGPWPYTAKPIKFTAEQRAVVDQAIAQVRRESGDQSMKEGRCLELMAADFLAGNPNNKG